MLIEACASTGAFGCTLNPPILCRPQKGRSSAGRNGALVVSGEILVVAKGVVSAKIRDLWVL